MGTAASAATDLEKVGPAATGPRWTYTEFRWDKPKRIAQAHGESSGYLAGIRGGQDQLWLTAANTGRCLLALKINQRDVGHGLLQVTVDV